MLGWLVWYAMSCGTTKLWLGVDRTSGEPWMKVFGPRWYRKPRWWDLVPPEAHCYPVMLQVGLSLARLETGMPIRGRVPAIWRGKHLQLELNVVEIDSFQLGWNPELACDRENAGTSYPDETSEAVQGAL